MYASGDGGRDAFPLGPGRRAVPTLPRRQGLAAFHLAPHRAAGNVPLLPVSVPVSVCLCVCVGGMVVVWCGMCVHVSVFTRTDPVDFGFEFRK